MKYATYDAYQGSKFMQERTIHSVHKSNELAQKAATKAGSNFGVVPVVDSAKRGELVADYAI